MYTVTKLFINDIFIKNSYINYVELQKFFHLSGHSITHCTYNYNYSALKINCHRSKKVYQIINLYMETYYLI